MKKGKGSPRFFCEHCGAEVSLKADACPSCGRSFASIRCPKCGFTGDQNQFGNGCPDCGYSAKFDESLPSLSAKEPFFTNASLPLWVYFITIAAFVAAAVILFYRLR
jgi:predicted amidophosphoribosyltransferase